MKQDIKLPENNLVKYRGKLYAVTKVFETFTKRSKQMTFYIRTMDITTIPDSEFVRDVLGPLFGNTQLIPCADLEYLESMGIDMSEFIPYKISINMEEGAFVVDITESIEEVYKVTLKHAEYIVRYNHTINISDCVVDIYFIEACGNNSMRMDINEIVKHIFGDIKSDKEIKERYGTEGMRKHAHYTFYKSMEEKGMLQLLYPL